MRKIKGKKGSFWGCTRYPEGCQQTLPAEELASDARNEIN